MASEPALLDTNVLVYATDPHAPQHAASYALVEEARLDPESGLCVTPQVLAELYSALTWARARSPRTPSEAIGVLEVVLSWSGLRVLPVTAAVTRRLVALLRETPITGRRVHDMHIVATMLENGIRRIYTFNTRDFASIDGLEVVLPQA